MDQLTLCLQHAQSSNPVERKAAEEQLAGLKAAGAATFLVQLAAHIANEAKPADTRRLAGLLLKNAVSAEEEGRRAERAAFWRACDPAAQASVRAALLTTLCSPVKEARHTAAQVVGKLGALDLAVSQWPDLIPALQSNVASPMAGVKQASLEALGYVCEALDPTALAQEAVNTVLTAVVAGMRREEEAATRVVATAALGNALAFARKNFETEAERNYLMQVLCEGAMAPEVEVREACMECLADVAEQYYPHLGAYVEAVFTLTQRAFADAASEPVALKALDFWANVCDREGEAAEEAAEAAAARAPRGGSAPAPAPGLGIAAGVAAPLVPLLLAALPSRAPDEAAALDDAEEWTLSQASGMCLQALARAVGDRVLDAVMPFVQAHVGSADWRAREAAVTAFGTLVEGPGKGKLVPVAAHALPSLLNLLSSDPSVPVRRAAAWCLGVVFEALHNPGEPSEPQVLPPAGLKPALEALLATLTQGDMNVADSAIYALDRLALGYGACCGPDAVSGAPAASTPLSPYFSGLVQALLVVASRPDAVKLAGDAYEALCDTLEAATAAELPFLTQLLAHLLQLLGATCDGPPPGTPEGVEARSELQGHLCCALTVATNKLAALAPDSLRTAADHCMGQYLRVLSCRQDSVHGEALLAVSSLTDPLGKAFAVYMPALLPVLERALKNYEDAATCAGAVGLVGDVSRALGADLLPWADAIMLLLLQDLSSPELSRMVKPQILSCFGDVALALGPAFDRFLPHVAAMLSGAATHSVAAAREARDDEAVEHNNELRTAILEAYSGICAAFSGEADKAAAEALLLPQARAMAEFVGVCYADGTADDGVLRAAVGVLGDLASLPRAATWLATMPSLVALLAAAQASEDAAVREAAAFAGGALAHAANRVAS